MKNTDYAKLKVLQVLMIACAGVFTLSLIITVCTLESKEYVYEEKEGFSPIVEKCGENVTLLSGETIKVGADSLVKISRMNGEVLVFDASKEFWTPGQRGNVVVATYRVGTSDQRLMLYGNGTFAIEDLTKGVFYADEQGKDFTLYGEDILGNTTRLKLKSTDNFNILYGKRCEGNISLGDNELLQGSCYARGIGEVVFNAEKAVLTISNESYDYSLLPSGILRCLSQRDGEVICELFFDRTNTELFSFVFVADGLVVPDKSSFEFILKLPSVSEEQQSIDSLSENGDGELLLYCTVLMGSKIGNEDAKDERLERILNKEEDEELARAGEDIRINQAAGLKEEQETKDSTAPALDERVIAEIGEENLAPEDETGAAIIDIKENYSGNEETENKEIADGTLGGEIGE